MAMEQSTASRILVGIVIFVVGSWVLYYFGPSQEGRPGWPAPTNLIAVVVGVGVIYAIVKYWVPWSKGPHLGPVLDARVEFQVAAIAEFGNANWTGPMVRIFVINATDQTGRFFAKAAWLVGGRVFGDAWEMCWSRTSGQQVSIGDGDRRELNVVVIDDLGRGFAVEPSYKPLSLHRSGFTLFDNVGELGIKVWRDGTSGYSECGIRIVYRGPTQPPIVTFDDAVLPEDW